MEDTKFYTIAEAGEEIDKKIQEFMKMYSEADYSKAYVEVLKRNPELAEAYTKGVSSKKEYVSTQVALDKIKAGEKLARMIERTKYEYKIDFSEAMSMVLSDPENSELVRLYTF